MESGLRPAGCRPPLTSLFRQILRTLGAQNRREDTNLAKAGFLILALHGTVGLFFYLPGFGICRKRNTKNGSGSGIRKARLGGNTGRLFFFRGKSIFTLRKGGKRRKATKRGKRRQCPSSCKSCVSAVMPRAMCIGESNRPGRKMKQRRPTHGFRQRRCPCRRGARGITAKSAPKSAQTCVPAQIFWNALPQFRWKNNVIRFRILKIHPLFAHRRRNAEDSSTPDARFRQRRRIRRRGEGTRIIYVRGTSARGITAESVPKSAQIYALREFFLIFSKKFRFRCNEKAKNIVYIIYGHCFVPRNALRGAPLCVRTRLHRESESTVRKTHAECAKSVGKAPDINISSQIFTPNAAPDRTASSESGIYSIRAFPYCKIRQSML